MAALSENSVSDGHGFADGLISGIDSTRPVSFLPHQCFIIQNVAGCNAPMTIKVQILHYLREIILAESPPKTENFDEDK